MEPVLGILLEMEFLLYSTVLSRPIVQPSACITVDASILAVTVVRNLLDFVLAVIPKHLEGLDVDHPQKSHKQHANILESSVLEYLTSKVL